MTSDELLGVSCLLYTILVGNMLNFFLGKPQALRLDQIKSHRWNVLRCSAMTGENLKEGLAWVVEDAKARLFLY